MEYKSNILENLQPDYIQLNSNVYADELTGNVSIGEVQGATFTNKFMVKAKAGIPGGGVNHIVLQHSGNGVAIAGIGQESSHGSLQLRLNSGATQVRLSAINDNYILPRLGINTTSPQAFTRLDVRSGGTDGNAAIAGYGYNGVGGFAILGHAYATDNTHAGSATGLRGISNGGRSVSGSVNIGGYFTASGSESNYALITDSGNVGIGTPSPQAALHVAGAFNTTAPTGNGVLMGFYSSSHGYIQLNGPSGGYIDFSTSGTDHKGRLLYDNTGNYMRFDTNGSEKMRIDSSGNVGIGVAPAGWNTITPLQIKNASFAGLTSGTTHVTYVGSNFYYDSGDKYIADGYSTLYTQANGIHSFLTAPENTSGAASGLTYSQSMIIDAAGNVGIGATSPDEKLEVAGNVRIFDTGYPYIDLGVSTSNYFRIIHDNPNDILKIGKNGAFTSSSLIIQGGTGNVGIGGVPVAKLDIEGDLQVKGVNISNQENTDVDTGTEAIASVLIATYTAAFFDFVIKKGTNVRSGTVYACHDGTNVEFTETSTQDLGDTSDVTLNVVISTIYLQLQATTTSDDWSVKSLIRAI